MSIIVTSPHAAGTGLLCSVKRFTREESTVSQHLRRAGPILEPWKVERHNNYGEVNEMRRSRQLFFAMFAAVLTTVVTVLPAFAGLGTSPSLR